MNLKASYRFLSLSLPPLTHTHTLSSSLSLSSSLPLSLPPSLLYSLGTQIFSKVPEVDLQCSGSGIHVHLCVDSCQFLRDLLLYLSRNGDLQQQPEPQESRAGSELSVANESPAAVVGNQSDTVE